jgi:hypothetical protein
LSRVNDEPFAHQGLIEAVVEVQPAPKELPLFGAPKARGPKVRSAARGDRVVAPQTRASQEYSTIDSTSISAPDPGVVGGQ